MTDGALPRILFAPVLQAERWLSIDLQQQDILHALRAREPSLDVTIATPNESLAALPLGRSFLRDFQYPRQIRRAAAQLSHCLLHVSDHSYGHLCAAHQPCVVNCNDLHHFVDSELPPAQLRRWQARARGLRHAARVIALSERVAREIQGHLDIPAERIAVIPGGVDSAIFHPFPLAEAALRLPVLGRLREDHILILHLGANIRCKNLPTLLRAIRTLHRSGRSSVRLAKIGDPLRGSEHETLIRKLGIAGAIADLGRLPAAQVAAACRLAHVLSFPSLYEGFGRPTLEAQASDLPCVLSDTPHMREIGGEGALYHAPLDHEQLASALATAAFSPEVRENLIAAGRRNAVRFTWSRHAEQLLRVYREIGG